MKKNIYVYVVVTIIVAAGAFYGGMKYTQGSASTLSSGQRQQMMGQFRNEGNFTGGRRMGSASGGSFLNGEIISKDDKSITLKLTDGGSKIIFLSNSTNIGKLAEGTKDDLKVGTQITTNGAANSDGSVTAQSIQIRPNLPTKPATTTEAPVATQK